MICYLSLQLSHTRQLHQVISSCLLIMMGASGRIKDEQTKRKQVFCHYLVNIQENKRSLENITQLGWVFQERKNHVVMVLSFLVTVLNMVITSFQGRETAPSF